MSYTVVLVVHITTPRSPSRPRSHPESLPVRSSERTRSRETSAKSLRGQTSAPSPVARGDHTRSSVLRPVPVAEFQEREKVESRRAKGSFESDAPLLTLRALERRPPETSKDFFWHLHYQHHLFYALSTGTCEVWAGRCCSGSMHGGSHRNCRIRAWLAGQE